jgi:hypothetical protein
MDLSEYVCIVLLDRAALRRAVNVLIKAWLRRTVSISAGVIWINPKDPVLSGANSLRLHQKTEPALFGRQNIIGLKGEVAGSALARTR